MASYIVRIYRLQPNRSPSLDGLLEQIHGKARHPFHSTEELWKLILKLEPEITRQGKEARPEQET